MVSYELGSSDECELLQVDWMKLRPMNKSYLMFYFADDTESARNGDSSKFICGKGCFPPLLLENVVTGSNSVNSVSNIIIISDFFFHFSYISAENPHSTSSMCILCIQTYHREDTCFTDGSWSHGCQAAEWPKYPLRGLWQQPWRHTCIQ